MACGCKSRSFRLWRHFASYQSAEASFYLPSGLRVPRDFVLHYPTRAALVLLAHLFFWRT